jgi:indolepyruvate ferredoxin oxidoreductase alpha subunit
MPEKNIPRLLSGNEALALGAYHAGVRVAAAYPGTPSTEILENLARFPGLHAQWSANEKVAMEVALGASYAGVRALVSMKQVGLNVASDPFMAAATTGVDGGLVVACADDPGIHSSQCEQDNRHFARLAKVPMLEPADSQEAYDFMPIAFGLSEQFDTPVLLRTTTRIAHSKTLVQVSGERPAQLPAPSFKYNPPKYVMLPTSARLRRPLIEERLVKLAEYAETAAVNRIIHGTPETGIICSGISFQYAREVIPGASFLKLGMTYPLPRRLIAAFATEVKRIFIIEELDPFLEEIILSFGVPVTGKEFFPRVGELSVAIVASALRRAGALPAAPAVSFVNPLSLPKRPPVLCPGCPHSGAFYALSTMGQRSRPRGRAGPLPESGMVITGDIGCYTLGAYPPLSAMDTTTCMGAGIGEALGMEKSGLYEGKKIVALIGDSTFVHSGMTGLADAVYNHGHFTLIILDNSTTAMTGHQDHPGTGISARGEAATQVNIEAVVRGIGVKNVAVVPAFEVKTVRAAIRAALDSRELSVVIVRGGCSVRLKQKPGPRAVDGGKCDRCGVCLMIGCPAIQDNGERIAIDATLCAGDACTICQQICPRKAISPAGAPHAG